MRKNLLKQLTLALLMLVAVPYAKSQVAHVGDILCTSGVYVSPAEFDDSGLEAMGVIFYVDATGQHGWAVALEDAGCYIWSNGTFDTPLPDYHPVRAAIYDLDGLFNTAEILNWDAPSSYSFPAFEALDVANGWYLPAIGQLNYLYGNLIEVNTGLTVAGGTLFDMTGSWQYWSSTETQNSNNVWTLNSTGKIDGRRKDSTPCITVRGVRNF